jgi:Electron transfer DM13
MKNLLFLLFTLCIFAFSCKKDKIDTIDTPIVINPTDKELFKGTFTSGAHTTTGSVKIIEKADMKKYLVFENLVSDAGPDLRIYLSNDKNASNFTELTADVKNGNYELSIPTTADLSAQKYVLVWCKQFSVLFGSAELK